MSNERFPEDAPRSGLRLFLLACTLALVAPVPYGCGRSGLDVQMVVGKATLDGQPLAGATVAFSPLASGTTGLAAVGMTRDDGSFRLTAVQGGPPERGTMVGDYTVTFTKITHAPPGKAPPPPVAGPLPIFYLVPAAYGSRETSGLTATVKRGVNEGPEFTFDLRSDYTGKSSGGVAAAGSPRK